MTDINQLVEVGARAVHEALSRAHVIAYLDMPEDTADVVSRAYLAAILPLLADDLAGVINAAWMNGSLSMAQGSRTLTTPITAGAQANCTRAWTKSMRKSPTPSAPASPRL